jgi:hypothetical protein
MQNPPHSQLIEVESFIEELLPSGKSSFEALKPFFALRSSFVGGQDICKVA